MKKITQSLFALSTLTLAIQAGAAGFALNETSASAAGTAYAGRGSNAEDASIMASNPAGIALLDQAQVTGGMGVVVPKGEFEGTGTFAGTPVNGSEDNFLKTAVIPFGYFAMPLDDQWSFGLGVYAPFGSKTDYDDDWVGRHLANKTDMSVINVQPTVAYKFSDQLSVGFGVFSSYAKGELSRFLAPVGGYPGAGLTENDYVNVEGDSWAFGWNIGAVFQPLETTTVGFSYRSKVDHTVKGDATGSSGLFGGTATEKAKLDITLPEQAELSLTYQLDDRWTVMAGASWTRWSRFEKLVIESDQGGGNISNPPGLGAPATPGIITYVPENWKDVWAFALGASYQYSDQLTLKAGYAFDQSPVKDEYRTARIPDSDRNWLTVGAKYTFDKDWTVDAAYGYMFAKKVSIDEDNYGDDGGSPTIPANLDGEYNNKAHVFSVSLTKRF